MKVSVKVTRQQFIGFYVAVEQAVWNRNVFLSNETFLVNAHLANLSALRVRLYKDFHTYKIKTTIRVDHNEVMSLHYIFSTPPFNVLVDLPDSLLLKQIFEAADTAMQREVNMIKAAVRS